MPTVTLRYWASARAAAGVPEDLLEAGTLAEALAAAAEAHPEGGRLARVLSVCSYVVDGTPLGRRAQGPVTLAEGTVIEVLPPFAGG